MNEEFILVLQSKHNTLRSIYRKIKRQDDPVGMNAPLFLFLAFLQQQKKDVVLKVVAQSFEK